MQIARVAVLLLSLGCVSGAFADTVSAPYDEDMTSSDVVQMDDLQVATIDDYNDGYSNNLEYNNNNNDDDDEDE